MQFETNKLRRVLLSQTESYFLQVSTTLFVSNLLWFTVRRLLVASAAEVMHKNLQFVLGWGGEIPVEAKPEACEEPWCLQANTHHKTSVQRGCQ